MRRTLIESLQLLRAFRSCLLPPSCRFAPTCSQFAVEALERHRPWTALSLAARRVLRCHPAHPGGFDPVP